MVIVHSRCEFVNSKNYCLRGLNEVRRQAKNVRLVLTLVHIVAAMAILGIKYVLAMQTPPFALADPGFPIQNLHNDLVLSMYFP